ncbi:uncharacterized protein LOC128683366 [Plodia interpunctella]|uniref:uncharacterized protein LOC128683366 n=1 Tax=Plodia interpunctella TaxID=58824 RepID=UPI002367BE55|nr:uncharacterized protein LOC128683366 [Plodia interpunctella]
MENNSDGDIQLNRSLEVQEKTSRQESDVVEEIEWDDSNFRNTEKRKTREDESNSEKGFQTVTRRKRAAKRLLRSNSHKGQVEPSRGESQYIERYEVCITSLEILPKQMAMAKLLRGENISNILRIKYKSPYKVLIQVEDEETAEKLLGCQKILNMGCRCQMTTETSFCYGIVKNVDLDMTEKDLVDVVESSAEVVSIKRLNRIDADGKWVPSETIRLCFKGTILPPYITAYGCRFKVDTYIFPVTQCSGCWKFGHVVKFCPTKKIVCPKCGENHENCEIKEFSCANCKGSHLALDKICPIYQKEKLIRSIMSKNNTTYRKALLIYKEEMAEKEESESEIINWEMEPTPAQATGMDTSASQPASVPISGTSQNTYSNVVGAKTMVQQTRLDSEETPASYNKKKNDKKNKKKEETKGNLCNTEKCSMEFEEVEMGNNKKQESQRATQQERRSKFRIIFERFKDILLSNVSVGEKIFLLLQLIVEQCKVVLKDMFTDGEMLGKIFKLFNG